MRKFPSYFTLFFFISTFCVSSSTWAQTSNVYTTAIKYVPINEELLNLPMPKVPDHIDKYLAMVIEQECFNNAVPYLLVLKLIEVESQWNIKAKNYNKDKNGNIKSYDVNLMQINSKNFEYFISQYRDKTRPAKTYDLINNPYDNVIIGIRHLRYLYNKYGDWKLSVTAYNAGETALANNNISDRTKRYVSDIIPVDYWWEMLPLAKL